MGPWASYLPGWREEPLSTTEIAYAGPSRRDEGLFKNRSLRLRSRCALASDFTFSLWKLFMPQCYNHIALPVKCGTKNVARIRDNLVEEHVRFDLAFVRAGAA